MSIVCPMMNNTFNSLASTFNEVINDKVFCTLLDGGVDPGVAYDATFKTDFNDLTLEAAEITEYDDFVEDLDTFVVI